MDKIIVRAIIEMLGGPKEYIEKTLRDYVAKLKSEGTKIVREDYAEAHETENKLFSAFAELEVEFSKPEQLLFFCFDSMPSSVEVVSPDELRFSAAELNAFLNDLQAKLHGVDMVVKTLKAQNAILDKNALNILHNFVHLMLAQGPKSISELSKAIGVEPHYLEPFLKKLCEEKIIELKEEKYFLKK